MIRSSYCFCATLTRTTFLKKKNIALLHVQKSDSSVEIYFKTLGLL